MLMLMKLSSSMSMCNSFNCGFDTMSEQMVNMNMQFYMMLMLFILFDVELLFIYSFTCMNSYLYSMLYLLVAMLMVSYLYEMNEGMLCWV